jgi:hypothetical protein
MGNVTDASAAGGGSFKITWTRLRPRARDVDGVAVLVDEEDGLLVENIAVQSRLQARGIGRALLAFAELEAGLHREPSRRQAQRPSVWLPWPPSCGLRDGV